MIAIITVVAAELIFKPRLDITVEKKLLLWYGRGGSRYFVVLF